MRTLELLKSSGQDILIFIVLGVLILLFLKDFKLTSRRSWSILLGLVSLGGIFAFQYFRRRNLLMELAKRERDLKQLENAYAALRDEGKITEAKYRSAREELDRAKRDAAKSVLGAEDQYREKLEAIEKEHATLSPEELIMKSFEIIKEK